MKVWVIGRNYPLPGNGMQGSFELEQAKMLARFGNDVQYLACSLHPTKRIRRRGMLSWGEDGLEVNVLSAFFVPRVFPLYLVKFRNSFWRKLFAAVESRHGLPEVIHVHYPAMLMIADALAEYRRRGVRIIATEHWTKVLHHRLDWIELREYRKFSKLLDQMLCVGSPLAKSTSELIGREVKLLPNVVSELFRPSSKGHPGFRFVAVGRLIALKQFDRVVAAFAECFRGNAEVTLTIIGDGEERSRLQTMIQEGNLEAQVRLLGSQSRQQTAEIVSECDNLVCYSEFETFGVPVIEAWACGLTTTCTSTAAVVIDNFDDRLGVKVSPTDFDGLKSAMRFVYEHRDDYDREFIANFAFSHFSETEIYRRLEEIYMK